ncbi:hypothetical protein PF010_g4355 [Phytophthora fragariae]|uniref:Uncharacterized protein n=2 Tax=Phytophthora fragariae TaxID=53985 RepID=A0A6G0LSY3_9STRA|nr:hypothetical protein PF010_g4355 [Phytophthora fragariae]
MTGGRVVRPLKQPLHAMMSSPSVQQWMHYNNTGHRSNDGMDLEALVTAALVVGSHRGGFGGIELPTFWGVLLHELGIRASSERVELPVNLQNAGANHLLIPFLSPPNVEWPDWFLRDWQNTSAKFDNLCRFVNADRIDFRTTSNLLSGEYKDYSSLVMINPMLDHMPDESIIHLVVTKKMEESYFTGESASAFLRQQNLHVWNLLPEMSSRQQSELDAATQEKITDLFDNEGIWNADDTDGYIVQLFQELEAAGANIVTIKDQGWNSLLHTASLWNRPKIMEELIRRGAPLNEKNKNGHTPLDLAMHWGHFDLGQQLQHYGGKHTCEKERDIAISQRDLAQQELKSCELEYEHAVRSLKQAKQEREQLRIERDRLVVLRAQVVEDCRALSTQVEDFRTAVASLTKERDTLHIQVAQLQNELVCEQTARNNAVQSWRLAEKVIAELQQAQEECRDREEEALRLRNEAIQDRDVARERAMEAELDQGIAKQNQLEVERERDQAIEQLLAGEAEIAHDKEKWRKRIAKTELERRNIQIEIDRQTELLRCENAKLEKMVATLTVVDTRQRADLERNQLTTLTLEKQLSRQQHELLVASEQTSKLKDQVETLLEERRQEHKAWRTQMESKLKQEYADNLKTMLEAVVSTWKSLQSCQQEMATLGSSSIEHHPVSPSRTPAIMSAIFQTQRPHTSTAGLHSPAKSGFLPFLQEAPTTGLKTSTSTPELSEPLHLFAMKADSPQTICDDLEQTINSHREHAETALQDLTIGAASEQIVQLCLFVQKFMTDLSAYIASSLQRLRKQTLAQEKMIERKGELIQRFTHHRQEKAKRQNPARFRECSVRPQL